MTCNQRLPLTLKREKIPLKVVSSTIQANVNLFMFRAEFVVKKKLFLTSSGLSFFSAKASVGNEF